MDDSFILTRVSVTGGVKGGGGGTAPNSGSLACIYSVGSVSAAVRKLFLQ